MQLIDRWRKWRQKSNITMVGVDEAMGGSLNTASATWSFMLKWCDDEIEKARKANDNLSIGGIKTTILRSRIQTLNDIKDIPNAKHPIDLRGLLASDFEDSETFSGY